MARPSESYTSPRTIEEVFSRKLETLCARVRDVVYYGIVYVVSNNYSCKYCKCRIMVRGNEKIFCVRCAEVPFWPETTRASVAQLLQQYPTLQECQAERRPPQIKDTPPEAVAFGARIKEARLAHGWSQAELALRIKKDNGDHLAASTIRAIERGQSCSKDVKEQLEKVLKVKEGMEAWAV